MNKTTTYDEERLAKLQNCIAFLRKIRSSVSHSQRLGTSPIEQTILVVKDTVQKWNSAMASLQGLENAFLHGDEESDVKKMTLDIQRKYEITIAIEKAWRVIESEDFFNYSEMLKLRHEVVETVLRNLGIVILHLDKHVQKETPSEY